MSNLAQDVRFALRVFQRAPGFAAAAVLTLAVGIGANTSIFSVANALLLRPLPYREPGRLVLIDTRRKFDAHLNQGPLSVPRFEQVEQRNRSFGVRAALGSGVWPFPGSYAAWVGMLQLARRPPLFHPSCARRDKAEPYPT